MAKHVRDASEERQLFRERLRDFVQIRLHTAIDKLPPMAQSKQMTWLYLTEVVRFTDPTLLPEDDEDLEAGYVDGGNDLGVDFLWKQDDRVFIVQSKYLSRKAQTAESEVSHFQKLLARLKDPGKHLVNERLAPLLADLDWDQDKFELHFLTLSKASEGVQKYASTGIVPIDGLPSLQERSDLILLDESALNVKLREAASSTQSLTVPVSIQFDSDCEGRPWLEIQQGDRVSYVGRVSGKQLYELYRPLTRQNRLFAMNIRHYVGNTETNKGIAKSAFDCPENFYFFNNGISAIASNIDTDEEHGKLDCKQFSIINGAQTVKQLAKLGLKGGTALERLDNLSVLMRVTEIRNKVTSPETQFIESITRFNNTQNEVKLSDFRSNDPVQLQLARYFSGKARLGKPVIYRNKRSGDRDAAKYSIGLEEFTKTIFAFRFGPDDMYGGTKALFDISTNGNYQKLFGPDGPNAMLTEDTLAQFAGIWLLCDEARKEWKTLKAKHKTAGPAREDADARMALERRWLVYYALGVVVREISDRNGTDLESDLRTLSKPYYWNTKGAISAAWPVTLACNALLTTYRSARQNKESFTHRNWFRSEATLKSVQDSIRTLLDSLPPQPKGQLPGIINTTGK